MVFLCIFIGKAKHFSTVEELAGALFLEKLFHIIMLFYLLSRIFSYKIPLLLFNIAVLL